ncbi:MAG TPA: septum formation initiator family protein [Gemmatimonadaceae bacterium]|jgi:cell division protein FtsB|nr:septum formation initiator family protein [Gemmatimonadaceae bacterium]
MKRYVWWALIAVALFFAIQGGEYSTRDLYVLHSRTRAITREVDSLQRQVDSLGRFLKLVKSDSATQERIAREEFGMVRGDKEILYRFGEAPDTGKRK